MRGHGAGGVLPSVAMVSAGRLGVACLVAALGCVAAPEAQRNGATACQADQDCNHASRCGDIHLCVDGYCAADTIFRVCADGGYPEAGTVVGECLTYLNCNPTTCGVLVPCVSSRCDRTAAPLFIPCDGGADADAAFTE